jgi:hypothetical protein
MVATMDTTIPPKLIITHPGYKKTAHVGGSKYFGHMIIENNWGIKERKKRVRFNCIQPTYSQHIPFYKYCECHYRTPHHHQSTFPAFPHVMLS